MTKTESDRIRQLTRRSRDLPRQPGCYLFRAEGEHGKVLYVGKAKSLRERVRQYFGEEAADRRAFVKFIREKTSWIDFIVVETEEDALLLENELIKRHKPPYNIQLRDDKRYLSLRIDTAHEWPRIDITRRIKKDKAVYFGPFLSSFRLKETLNLLQRVFPLRTCPDSKLYNRSRPCLEYEIKRCVAPCVGYVRPEDYKEIVDSVVLFFKGQSESLVKKIQEKMEKAVEKEDYESAALYRDQIQAVTETLRGQGVYGHRQLQSGNELDAIGFALSERSAVISVVFVRNGMIWDHREFQFSRSEMDSEELLEQFISRYYQQEIYVPAEVLVGEKLQEVEGLSTKLIVPRSEEKRQFLRVAEANARSRLEEMQRKEERSEAALLKLKERLSLDRLPVEMDCVDVSHHQGDEVVASVVRFTEGRPNKTLYRKFILHTEKVDDFASMKEVLSRRYRQAENLPDLLVVDGGKGQLNVALTVLRELNLEEKLGLVSLAKARAATEVRDPLNPKNRERVFLPGRKNPVLLPERSAEEYLLTEIRDEAHRFAIEFHRDRKTKKLSLSKLDELPGMTRTLKTKLLKNFGSIEAIRQAEDVELLKIIRPQLLSALREILRDDEGYDF